MRNLQLRKHYVLAADGKVPSAAASSTSKSTGTPTPPLSSSQPTAACWDGDSIIYTTGPSPHDPLLTLRRWKPTDPTIFGFSDSQLFSSGRQPQGQPEQHSHIITSFDAPSPLPSLACDRIVSVYPLPEKAALCLVLAGGDLILVREEPAQGEERIEIVGSVEVGLLAAEWSPDGELLALATRAGTLLLMTRELESSAGPVAMVAEDLALSKHVDVGWGKKETQFTGRGARALRDPTMPEKVDEGLRSQFDVDDDDVDDGVGNGGVGGANESANESANEDGLDAKSEKQGRTTISWRGDGAFLAVNSRLPGQRRVLRVYSREGLLDGVSEPVDYLEAGLSWRPAGNLLASVQRRAPDQVDIVFFERNGLRHGEFSLRPTPKLSHPAAPDPMSRLSLRWNCDSSVLAVCFADRVQLWAMGNYHYYLKQEIITFDTSAPDHGLQEQQQQPPPIVSWHPEHPLKYVLVTGGSADVAGNIEMRQYAQVVSRSSTAWGSQTGTVAVVDGRTLKLTSLRYANVPPPMAQDEFTLDYNIGLVAVHTAGAEEEIAVVNGNTVSLLVWKPQTKDHMAPKLVSTVQLPGQAKDANWRSIVFTDESTVLIAGTSLLRAKFQDAGGEYTLVGMPDSFSGNVLAVKVSGVLKPLVQARGGHIAAIDGSATDTGKMANQLCQLPRDADVVEAISLHTNAVSPSSHPPPPDTDSDGILSKDSTIVFGMTRSGALYANAKCLAKDCTSFAVTPAHLVYTTTKHLLKFVHLGPVDELEIPSDTPEVDERCRAVERGTRLVSIVPSTGAVILQMPRGNLETIFPRALVLAEIRRNIDDKKYRKAFLNCRKQRVDMNILYDYKPEQLLDNIALFVDQVQKVEHIDLFLSQLRDEDVSVSMYKNTLPNKKGIETTAIKTSTTTIAGAAPLAAPLAAATAPSATAPGKTNKICNAFLPILRARSSTNLQNTITAHVVKNPPDIDAGLLEVAKLQATSEKDGDRAVEHICFLVDVNKLYDAALGLYDLSLTLSIADRSQKDPREFMPFLQRLNDLPEGRRRFEIDDHLFRHRKALNDLWELLLLPDQDGAEGERGDEASIFAEYKKYAARHELYDDALQACRYDEPRYREIMTLYAAHLQARARHRDAAIALEYLGQHEAASESYRLAHMWRESLTCASLAYHSSDLPKGEEGEDEKGEGREGKVGALAELISEALVEHRQFADAAVVQRDYLADPEAAARLFCRGYRFADAFALLSLRRLRSGPNASASEKSVTEIVDAGLTECMGVTTELLADCRAQLKAQVPRIRELRVKKAQEPLAYYEGTNPAGGRSSGHDIPDNISIATTNVSTMGGSLFTRYTGKNTAGGSVASNATRKTAKKNRKEERKRAQGKKGSVYEEEYLVNSVGRLMDRVSASAEDTERLVVGLMRRGMRERAAAVDEAMREVVRMCGECRDEVFGVVSGDPGLDGQDAAKGGFGDAAAAATNFGVDTGSEQQQMPQQQDGQASRQAPSIRPWEGLAVLGRRR